MIILKDKKIFMGSIVPRFPLIVFILFNFLDNIHAGVTSSFIRSEWPSDDMPLDNDAFAVPNGYNAPEQVHITQGDYNGKAIIITWVTPDEPGSNQVKYGKEEKNYDFTAEGTVKSYTFYNYTSGFIHECLIDDLEYDSTYYYEVGEGESARSFWFQTPPKIGPNVPYKFGIIGDLGQTYNSRSTLNHYVESGAQAVLHVGDLSYADKYEYDDMGVRWDTYGRFAERIQAYNPWISTAGNHEIEYMPYMDEVVPFKQYLYRYPTPYAASESSSPLWYAVRRASAHIIVLSSYSPFVKYTPQYKWLKAEFKKVNRWKTPWLIVIMHVPIYSSNSAHYMEGESMRAAFESWFVKYKVDVVFAGHVHAYERSHRISNIEYDVTGGVSYPVPDKSAPIYITVGDGGNQEGLASSFNDPQPDYSAFREASYGHSTLELINKTHAFYHWNRNDDGKKVATDSFVLRNQYWKKRKLEENDLHAITPTPELDAY
ncbi:bifunctional purple acid phosphatase 26 [Helianthus annuus]|uniref:bifunctional purple acid phosphatase 26 n=1 Tax=Helianthus annuus TaxID=4232 RepID=UPI000B909D67|nr:bifunctional purple acid phosphatase 26 [Helianthus annuus]XP_021990154.1 bifunctional purple acid phosphatase 26 [Helianthus annuus]